MFKFAKTTAKTRRRLFVLRRDLKRTEDTVTRLESTVEALLEHLKLYIHDVQPKRVIRSKGGPESGE